MSTSSIGPFSSENRTATASRVSPGSGPVIIRSSPSSRFSRVDFPRIRAAHDGEAQRAVVSLALLLLRQPVGDLAHQIGQTLAMFGRDSQGFAKP